MLRSRLIPVISGAAHGPRALSDPMTDTNGVTLVNHTTFVTWTQLSGGFTIQSNTAQATSGTMAVAVSGPGYADGAVGEKITLTGSGKKSVGLSLRAASLASRISVKFINDGGTTLLRVIERGNG